MDDRHRWPAVRSGTALSVPSSNVPSSWAGRDKVRTEQCTTAGFLGALGPKGQVPAPPAQRAELFLSPPPTGSWLTLHRHLQDKAGAGPHQLGGHPVLSPGLLQAQVLPGHPLPGLRVASLRG